MRLRIPGFALLLLLGGCALNTQAPPPPEVLVYLVRHAERAEDGSNDPHISQEGQERAQLLAGMLKDAGITHIHTTDFNRTRETVTPLSTAIGVVVEVYDSRDPEAFATWLRTTPGRHLVVGHSNTTPELVTALGGDPHGSIETMEYDRLYLLSVGGDPVSTVLLRFGAPFGG